MFRFQHPRSGFSSTVVALVVIILVVVAGGVYYFASKGPAEPVGRVGSIEPPVPPLHNICPGFDALGPLKLGGTYSRTFLEAKACPMHDHLNQWMRGTVTVR